MGTNILDINMYHPSSLCWRPCAGLANSHTDTTYMIKFMPPYTEHHSAQQGESKAMLPHATLDCVYGRFCLQSNSRDSESTLTPVSPSSKHLRTTSKATTGDESHRADSKVDNLFLGNVDQEAQGTFSAGFEAVLCSNSRAA